MESMGEDQQTENFHDSLDEPRVRIRGIDIGRGMSAQIMSKKACCRTGALDSGMKMIEQMFMK